MNHAQLILESLEKSASAGLVSTALEMATGAALGGAFGVMSARSGRQGDPIGPSDISGAVYGGVLGALAGPITGALIRSSAVQRGIADDSRLASMAEQIADLENLALHKKVKASNYTALKNRDEISNRFFGVDYQSISNQVNNQRMQLRKDVADAMSEVAHARSGSPQEYHAARQKVQAARDAAKAFEGKDGLGYEFGKMQKVINQFSKQMTLEDKLYSEHLVDDIKYHKSLMETERRRMQRQAREDARGSFFGFKF